MKIESKLTKIANKHTTDKGTVHYEAHGYTEVYNDYISDDKPITLLEIGIWHGDSIRMWNEYNENMILHAIDIDRNVFHYLNNNEKCTIHIGNQSDEKFINDVLLKIGDLDIVIDDGSHNFNDIYNSFKYIFPKLKKGSIYFIEDLHAPHANSSLLIPLLIKDNNYKMFCNNKLLMIIKQ